MNKFNFDINGTALRITVMSEKSVRVTYGKNSPSESMIVRAKAAENIAVKSEESDDEICLSTSFLRVHIAKDKPDIRFEKADGTVLSRVFGCSMEEYAIYGTTGGLVETRETVDGVRSTVKEAERAFSRYSNHAKLTVKFSEEESLYGLGSHEEGYASLRGQYVPLYQENMRIALPYFVSTKCYAYLFDCSSLMTFDGTDGRYGRFYFDSVDALDFYFICGEDFDDVCGGYRYLTGETPMLPKWAVGYIQSKERYVSEEDLLETARKYRQLGVPIDGIIQDWMYWQYNAWGEKRFDKSRYPDPAAMTKELHDMHMHLMISIWPNMSGESIDKAEFEAAGKMLGDHSVYNAFDEDARKLYWKQAYENLFSYGIDGWWCDSSEPFDAVWGGEERPPLPERMKKSTDEFKKYIDDSMINAYSLAHSRGIYEGQRGASDKRVINLTRSSYPGQHRYGTVVWSGDVSAAWETLRKQVRIAQNYISCGEAYWNTDIGGFFVRDGREWFRDGDFRNGADDLGYRELYTRWMQFAGFTPLMRSHGTDTPREVWQFGERGSMFRDAIEKAIQLRYSLSPYFYSLNAAVTSRGIMPLRPLALAFPNDRAAHNADGEYMYGHELLVCPVTHPMYYGADSTEIKSPERYIDVYLPEGTWYDFYTEQKYDGSRYVRVDCTIDRIPLFVRAGSVIPMAPVMQYVDEDPNAECEVRVYCGKDGLFSLYNDAGDGYAYENGDCTVLDISYCEKTGEISEKLSGAEKYRRKIKNRLVR